MTAIQDLVEKVHDEIAVQLRAFTGDKLSLEQCKTLIEVPKGGTSDYQVTIGKLNRYKKDYKMEGKPADIANAWAAKFQTSDLIIKCESGQGGYISLDIDKFQLMTAVFADVMAKQEKYGHCKAGDGKTVLVEFSSPNIAKVFHAGHLRSTILGNFLQNSYRATGHNVISYNYLGDWGKQYGLLAVAFARYGSREELEKNPIRHLYDLYVKANAQCKVEDDPIDEEVTEMTSACIEFTPKQKAREYFAKMEAGDEKALALWKEFRDLSIIEYKRIYARLGVSFDIFSGESQVSEGMEVAFKIMEDKKLLTLSKGATLIDLEPFKKSLGKCLIKKTDGSSLYLTRDVAAAAGRWEKHEFDKMLYVVGTAQSLHFSQLFKVLELMEYKWADRCTHINFGLVNGMSSRSGTAVFLEDILDEAKQAMWNVMKNNDEKYSDVGEDAEDVADKIGMSAVIVQDLSAKRHKDYDFNWDRMTAFEGETGPYLQYSHARLTSILRKAETELKTDADVKLLVEPQAQLLAVEISKFEGIILQACMNAEPVTLVTYLFGLCRAINSAFHVLQVKGSDAPVAEARLLLFESARITLCNGMRLLGLSPVERM